MKSSSTGGWWLTNGSSNLLTPHLLLKAIRKYDSGVLKERSLVHLVVGGERQGVILRFDKRKDTIKFSVRRAGIIISVIVALEDFNKSSDYAVKLRRFKNKCKSSYNSMKSKNPAEILLAHPDAYQKSVRVRCWTVWPRQTWPERTNQIEISL
mgnify:FL=1